MDIHGRIQSFYHLHSTKIQELYLSGNNIGAEGAKALAAALPSTKIQALDFSGNNVGSEGAEALIAALPSTKV